MEVFIQKKMRNNSNAIDASASTYGRKDSSDSEAVGWKSSIHPGAPPQVDSKYK